LKVAGITSGGLLLLPRDIRNDKVQLDGESIKKFAPYV